jgi:hypothetical protein
MFTPPTIEIPLEPPQTPPPSVCSCHFNTTCPRAPGNQGVLGVNRSLSPD